MRETGTMVESRLFFFFKPKWKVTWKPTNAGTPPLFQLSHASKSIINPIMIEILMRCALESDLGVIIRPILPVVESWSWTKACSVARSEGKKKKCCSACRSGSHLCLNQQLYLICFFLLRESLLTPLCLLGSTSPSDSSDQNDCSTRCSASARDC